jgi:hypothetical protein
MVRLLGEALRASNRVVIVEEIKGNKTDVVRAQLFDEEVNKQIHPNVHMPCLRILHVEGDRKLSR